ELSLHASVFSIDCLSLSVTIRCRRTERTVPAPAIYERPRSERLKWRRIPLRSTSYPLNEVTLFSDRPPARCGYRKFGARYRVGIGDGGLISCPVLRNYAVVQRPYTPGSFLHSYFTAACFPRRVTARYGLRRPPIIPRTTDARLIKLSRVIQLEPSAPPLDAGAIAITRSCSGRFSQADVLDQITVRLKADTTGTNIPVPSPSPQSPVPSPQSDTVRPSLGAPRDRRGTLTGARRSPRL